MGGGALEDCQWGMSVAYSWMGSSKRYEKKNNVAWLPMGDENQVKLGGNQQWIGMKSELPSVCVCVGRGM